MQAFSSAWNVFLSLEKENNSLSLFPQNEFPSGTSFWPVMRRFTMYHIWSYHQPVFGTKEVIFGRKKLGPVSVPVMLGEAGSWQVSLLWEGLCLCCRSQTHGTSSSTTGWRQTPPLQLSLISWWMYVQWHQSSEMRWKAEHIRARLTENLHVTKCGKLKD